jgi:L-rhamnonate dehydratase
MKILSVKASTFGSIEASTNAQPSWLTRTVIANPMSIYPRYHAQRSSWFDTFPQVLVEITTDEGIVGIGTAVGGDASVAIINGHFARLLAGEDPSDIERLWDEMFRSSLPYGRKGLPVMAISGVDEALWDLLGKAAGVPVYRLLGGACRDDLAIYQTTNDPEDWIDPEGFGIKLAIPYGPADGKEGLTKNFELVRECRDVVGPELEIMLDCYMAFDVEYTRRLIGLVEPLGVRWVEEPLAPDDYHGYEALGRIDSPVSIATGEHEFTRWGFLTLIETGGVAVLQPDVAWVGGISEARRICTLASSYNLKVIPHAGGNQAGALHLMKSQVNTPFAEWVRRWDRAGGKPPSQIEGVPDPVAGRVRPSDDPGLGIRKSAVFPGAAPTE